MIKKAIKWLLPGLLTVMIVFAVWITKPWLDHDPWRWYLAVVEGWRADLFSHFEEVCPIAR